MKRMFGGIEMIFDFAYLLFALIIGFLLIMTSSVGDVRFIAGVMGLILAFGDAFHLIPRMYSIFKGDEKPFRHALGVGKQITSVTMTIFYLLLWQIGLESLYVNGAQKYTIYIYLLAAVRIIICLMPQNKWTERYPPSNFALLRNIPFFALGMGVATLFFLGRGVQTGLSTLWIAILLSFLFYLPVVLFQNKNPKIGMLMLPKTCCYLWILTACLWL